MRQLVQGLYIIFLSLTMFAGVYTILNHLHIFVHHSNGMVQWVSVVFLILFISILTWGSCCCREEK